MTLLSGHVVTAKNSIKGFDCNVILKPQVCEKFVDNGYDFVARYVRRKPKNPQDLTYKEATDILSSGLDLSVVQHVAPENWIPTKLLGAEYGQIAAAEAINVGVPSGVNTWLDLEGVKLQTPSRSVIDFCNAWHSQVAASGLLPGIYVGWHCGLNNAQLYNDLRFTHYWGAYNYDNVPAIRGYQMYQYAMKQSDKVAGVSFEFDVNRVKTDKLGSRPTMLTGRVDV